MKGGSVLSAAEYQKLTSKLVAFAKRIFERAANLGCNVGYKVVGDMALLASRASSQGSHITSWGSPPAIHMVAFFAAIRAAVMVLSLLLFTTNCSPNPAVVMVILL